MCAGQNPLPVTLVYVPTSGSSQHLPPLPLGQPWERAPSDLHCVVSATGTAHPGREDRPRAWPADQLSAWRASVNSSLCPPCLNPVAFLALSCRCGVVTPVLQCSLEDAVHSLLGSHLKPWTTAPSTLQTHFSLWVPTIPQLNGAQRCEVMGAGPPTPAPCPFIGQVFTSSPTPTQQSPACH